MSHPLFGTEVRLMLAEHNSAAMADFCESLHPATVAETLDDEFTPEQIWEVISPSNIRTQAAIFEYLPLTRQIEMAETARPQVGQLIGKMSHDDRADLLRRLPPRVVEALIRLVDEADRKDIATLVQYGENTVGAMMTTDYAWLPVNMNAAEAIDQMRQQAPDRETIYYIYVLEDAARRPDGTPAPRRLLGVVSLRDLILAPRHAPIRDLMETEVVALHFDDETEKVTQLFARYDFIAVPVVDDKFGLLGIVTHDDVLDVVTEEATESLQRQAGVGPIEGNYLETHFWTVWYSRAKWLAVLFVLQMFTINVMGCCESRLVGEKAAEANKLAFIIIFIPLCLSVGGNAGSQAATLVTRAMALDQIRLSDWLHVFRRELLMAAALAAALGILSVIRTYFLTPDEIVTKVELHHSLWHLVWGVTLAVMGICLTGALVGAMLPILIKRLGGDPALMSSPLIATISDVMGIAIYFYIMAYFFI